MKIWSEYENEEFVVDHFDERYFSFKIRQFDDNRVFGYFIPHSHDEELDFVFEFVFAMDDDHITSKFSINI